MMHHCACVFVIISYIFLKHLPPLLFSCSVSSHGFCIQVGEAALSILHSMVSAHSDLDDAGELVTPTPRVKRILSSPRCLPHIAQVIFEFFMSTSFSSILSILAEM